MYYVLDWSKKSKQKGFYDYYTFLIHGSYKECCECIDKKIKEDMIPKKKVVKVINNI